MLVLTLPAVSTDKDRAESFFLGGGNRSPANEGAAEALRRGRSGDAAKVRQAAPQKNRPDETRRTRAAAKIEKKIVDEKAMGESQAVSEVTHYRCGVWEGGTAGRDTGSNWKHTHSHSSYRSRAPACGS